MNVMFISQCNRRALKETRRILDQFAERRGSRTWQTAITMEGLKTLRQLLRKTARKNTSVACHWIRGRDHSELMWVVGNGSLFNEQGAVPTNTTVQNVLRGGDENNWHNLPAIQWQTALAALMHDLGKACQAFQNRLKPGAPREKNLYRHEWISVRLFQAFVGDDTDEQWLQKMAANQSQESAAWHSLWLAEHRLLCDGLHPSASGNKPLAQLPPLARSIAWLVLTHHRLPLRPVQEDGRFRPMGTRDKAFNSAVLTHLLEQVDANWNEPSDTTDQDRITPYWQFPYGLPVAVKAWRKQAARFAHKLLPYAQNGQCEAWLADPYVMHLSRLSLMLADHYYSSLNEEADRKKYLNKDYPLYANTNRDQRGAARYNQTLDEHLLGVEGHANIVVRSLPGFDRHLPRLARHKGLKKRSDNRRFRWQDRAFDAASALRDRSRQNGAFIINMASTGCGKTLGNARIMYALSDPAQGMRCAFAMGLRTLTLQTGRSFRDLLRLSDDELAIKVGGKANRELFEFYEKQAEQSGSASVQDLLDEDGHVLFEGDDKHDLLVRLSRDPQVRSLLAAPILVCTVDHLTPATESLRGGRQIAPMLRLMSGDLVLDEPDDFDVDDLPALTRLVHWAGLLGARVLLSSATLPPAIVQGLFMAYVDGRQHFQNNRSDRPGEVRPITCLWVDEFTQAHADCTDANQFQKTHEDFTQKRHQKLEDEIVRRRSEVLPLSFTTHDKVERRQQFASCILESACRLHHAHHDSDPQTGKRVSFGLVRMANIEPLVQVALAMYAQGAPEGVRVHLCVYHSQFPLLLRSSIENQLDTALNRRKEDAVFELPSIRQRLDASAEDDHIFIVLGSPVTEVGRDHDYDWAVVEPSSMRSFIQLAGRIRRHRIAEVDTPNLLILDSNLRHFERPGEPAFCKPGFEQRRGAHSLTSHSLTELLTEQERAVIDARPRILQRNPLQPRQNLVDLEHSRLNATMLPQVAAAAPVRRRGGVTTVVPAPVNAATWWNTSLVTLTGVLQQQLPFRYDSTPRTDLVFLPDEENEEYVLHCVDNRSTTPEDRYFRVDASQHHRVPDELVRGERIEHWGQVDFIETLLAQAEALGLSPERCAQKFATVSVTTATQGWLFHPVLGVVAKT